MPIPDQVEAEEPEELSEEAQIDADVLATALPEEGEETAGEEQAEETAPAEEPVSQAHFKSVMHQRAHFKERMQRSEERARVSDDNYSRLVEQMGEMRKMIQGQQPVDELTDDQRFAAEVRAPLEAKLDAHMAAGDKRREERASAEGVERERGIRTDLVNRDNAVMMNKYPDFTKAIQHGALARRQQYLDEGFDEDDATRETANDINGIIREAQNRGVSPGEHLYRTAVQQYGWQTPEAGNGTEPAPAEPSRRDQLKRHTRSLSTVTGKAASADGLPSWGEVHNSDSLEYAALILKHGVKVIEAIEQKNLAAPN